MIGDIPIAPEIFNGGCAHPLYFGRDHSPESHDRLSIAVFNTASKADALP